ncbi:MAG: hypothetical protein ABI237_18065 [Ginsengibacter sp.]
MKLPLHKGLIKTPLQIRMPEQFSIDMDECPCCKNGTLKLIKVFYRCLFGRQTNLDAGRTCLPTG